MFIIPPVAFVLFGVPIRQTVVSTWVMMVILTVGSHLLLRRYPSTLELLAEFVDDNVSAMIGRPAAPYIPVLGSLTVFIAAANTVGVVPVVMSPTRDISTPAALALVVFFSVHWFGISEKGVKEYLKGLATPLVTLPLELIGQLSRTLSLTLRLFGNVLSTDLLVAVVFSLLPLIVPIPLMAFSLLTGLLQAYIFTVLAAVYIGAAVAASAD